MGRERRERRGEENAIGGWRGREGKEAGDDDAKRKERLREAKVWEGAGRLKTNQTTDWLTLQATGFVSSFSPPSSLPVA